MATITSQILKNISQNETVFSETDNKVFEWKENIQDWNSTSYFTEQATLSVGDKFKADSPDGDTTKLVVSTVAISGSVNATAAQIGGTHNQIKTALAKFDPTVQNSGILNFDNAIWSRKWAGKINDTLFNHNNPGAIYISDTDSLLDASSTPALGAGADNKWLIIDDSTSTTIDSYFGDAVLANSPVVPADTIFYVSTAEASNYVEYATLPSATAVKPGFYKTASSQVTLAADTFKTTLGSNVIPAAHDGSPLTDDDTRANAEVFNKANLLNADSVVTVVGEPNVDLAAPSSDNDFWVTKPAVAAPVRNNGSALGVAFSVDATAETLGTTDYWNVISSGLAQDISDTNNTLWSETNIIESSNALKYRG